MKKLICLIVLCSVFTAANAQNGNASCQSLLSSLETAFTDTWREYNDLREEAAAVLFGEKIGNVAALSLEFQENIYDRAHVVAGNGSSSVGPRYMYVETGANRATGSLVTDRTFICPPSGFDKVWVKITKTDGKAGADIAACLKNDKGEMVNKKVKSISKNSADGKSIEFTFFGAEDKFLSVHLVKTIGLNSFEYEVKVTGEMNKEKLEDDLESWKEKNMPSSTSGSSKKTTTVDPTAIKSDNVDMNKSPKPQSKKSTPPLPAKSNTKRADGKLD